MDNNSLQPISQAVQIIKTAILQSQERTTRNANADLIALNYAVGGYVSIQSKLHRWGSAIIRSISEQLQKEIPGLRGFGYENLKKMRQFYETWNPHINGSPTATQIGNEQIGSPTATQLPVLQSKALAMVFDVETAHDFISISFTHHMEILNKTNSLDERLFYIHNAAAPHRLKSAGTPMKGISMHDSYLTARTRQDTVRRPAVLYSVFWSAVQCV